MYLEFDLAVAQGYTSRSQIIRRISEDWGARNLYCAACSSDRLSQSPNNTRAVDFVCPQCQQGYQLKCSARWNERVTDAGYKAMMEAIQRDDRPNLLVMQYSVKWQVHNLLLVPSFFFTESTIEQRKPLGPNARRSGWVGCNILLSNVASEGKLPLVSNGNAYNVAEVRHQFDRVRPLANVGIGMRGWALDVLNVLNRLGRQPFTLQDVYAHEAELSALHPDNQHIRDKIRQQLQILRDTGLLIFLGRGRYRLT